jgi:hypothetical protein
MITLSSRTRPSDDPSTAARGHRIGDGAQRGERQKATTTVRQPRLTQVAAVLIAFGLGLFYLGTFDAAAASTKRRSKTRASTSTTTTTTSVPVVPGKVVVSTPTKGSKLRADLLRVVRPKLEARDVLGKPLDLVVVTMRVSGRFAWVVVHPQRPGGASVVVNAACKTNPKTFVGEYWLVRKGSLWTVALDRKPCDSTSIEDRGEDLGAPPELVGRTSWS